MNRPGKFTQTVKLIWLLEKLATHFTLQQINNWLVFSKT